jgi:hypothetical protein
VNGGSYVIENLYFGVHLIYDCSWSDANMSAINLRDVPDRFFDGGVWRDLVASAGTKQKAIELLDAADPAESPTGGISLFRKSRSKTER